MKDIKEIDNIRIYPIYLFMKFGKKERLKRTQQEGYMYMKNLQYFIDLEKRTREKGQGDKFEARMFKALSLKVEDYYTGKTVLKLGETDIFDSSKLQKPVFCMSAVNIYEEILEVNYPNFESKIQFDSKLMEDFSDDYEPYVLIINKPDEFLKRLKSKLDSIGINYRYGLVEYRDTEVLHKGKNGIEMNSAFNKEKYFEYQKEFRVLVGSKVEDYFDISIGSIEDISDILPAKSIINGLIVTGRLGKLIKEEL